MLILTGLISSRNTNPLAVEDSIGPRVGRRPRKGRRSLVPYRERRFVVWDGEADKDKEDRSNYILLGNSAGWELNGRRLGTDECLKFIVDCAVAEPDVIHIGFAIGFDVNMIVRDIPKRLIAELKNSNQCWYEQYLLEWMPQKWFRIYDTFRKVGCKIYDGFTFFMSSAVKAWQQYLDNDEKEMVREVTAGKDQRATFTYADLETIIRPYFRKELYLYEALFDRLRELFAVAGIYPRDWYGPGAVASTIFQTHARHYVQRDIPDGVIEGSQYAYFGGRFEQFYTGQYTGTVYSYDIRSAYPHAMRLLPDLHHGKWVHHVGRPPNGLPSFALYKVDYDYGADGHTDAGRSYMPMPFPLRDIRSAIHFPSRVKGWYWGPEVISALDWYSLDIRESWTFEPTIENERPFAFIEDMYQQRMEWKGMENQAQYALKLGMNSLYGKTAQRKGKDNESKAPRWHQLEYAGFMTSMCRGMMFSAMMQDPLGIIATETDGLFSRSRLDLPLGEGLGEWEEEIYDGVVYVQSGLYWLKKGEEWKKARVRGFGPGTVNVEDALRSTEELSPLVGRTNRFAGFNGYLNNPKWLTWMDALHVAKWGDGGKRAHGTSLCPKCCGTNEQMHRLTIQFRYGGESHKHFLPWRDGKVGGYSEELSVTADFREMEEELHVRNIISGVSSHS